MLKSGFRPENLCLDICLCDTYLKMTVFRKKFLRVYKEIH